MATIPEASPSSPSTKLTALIEATISIAVIAIERLGDAVTESRAAMLRFEALPTLQKQLLAIDLQVLASNLSPKCRHKLPKGI